MKHVVLSEYNNCVDWLQEIRLNISLLYVTASCVFLLLKLKTVLVFCM